jgi:hypothetical protein
MRPPKAADSRPLGATSAALLTYSLRRDDRDFVVFCFSKLEDAEVFCRDLWREALCSVGDNSEN